MRKNKNREELALEDCCPTYNPCLASPLETDLVLIRQRQKCFPLRGDWLASVQRVPVTSQVWGVTAIGKDDIITQWDAETSNTVSRETWTSAREGKATGTRSKAQAGKALGVQRRALQVEETDLGLGHGFLVRKDTQPGLQGKPASWVSASLSTDRSKPWVWSPEGLG